MLSLDWLCHLHCGLLHFHRLTEHHLRFLLSHSHLTLRPDWRLWHFHLIIRRLISPQLHLLFVIFSPVQLLSIFLRLSIHQLLVLGLESTFVSGPQVWAGYHVNMRNVLQIWIILFCDSVTEQLCFDWRPAAVQPHTGCGPCLVSHIRSREMLVPSRHWVED